GIDDRQRRLLLEGRDPAIPELRLVVQRVQDGGGVPLARAAVDADRGRPAVGKGPSGIMTGGASHGAIGGQPAIEGQFLAEGDFLRGLRLVARDCRPSQLSWEANLVEGPGPGQGTRFGDRRRLSGGLPGRALRYGFAS